MTNHEVDARHQVCNILYRYAEAVDDGDFVSLRQLFKHCEIHAGGTLYHGAAGIEKMFSTFTMFYNDMGDRVKVPEEHGKPGTSHIISNPIIVFAPDGNIAEARSRYSVFQARPGFPLQLIIQGRYLDRFQCVAGVWRLMRRSYRMDSVGDLSHHLASKLPADI